MFFESIEIKHLSSTPPPKKNEIWKSIVKWIVDHITIQGVMYLTRTRFIFILLVGFFLVNIIKVILNKYINVSAQSSWLFLLKVNCTLFTLLVFVHLLPIDKQVLQLTFLKIY